MNEKMYIFVIIFLLLNQDNINRLIKKAFISIYTVNMKKAN